MRDAEHGRRGAGDRLRGLEAADRPHACLEQLAHRAGGRELLLVLPGGARVVDQPSEQRRDLDDEPLLCLGQRRRAGAVEQEHSRRAERHAEGGTGPVAVRPVALRRDQPVHRPPGRDDLVEQARRSRCARVAPSRPALSPRQTASFSRSPALVGTKTLTRRPNSRARPRQVGGQDLGLRTGPGGAGDVEQEAQLGGAVALRSRGRADRRWGRRVVDGVPGTIDPLPASVGEARATLSRRDVRPLQR